MLGNTGYSLAQISELMGFSSPQLLFAVLPQGGRPDPPTNTAVRYGRDNALPRQNGMKDKETRNFK